LNKTSFRASENEDGALKPPVFRTVGFLLREDEEQVTVAGSICKDDEEKETVYRDTLVIPRYLVTKVVYFCIIRYEVKKLRNSTSEHMDKTEDHI
jgi:hypothetical protein